MRKRFPKVLAAVLSLLLILATPVYAEKASPVKISNLEINVMPEYDTTDVLVLCTINFMNTTSQPYTGEIRFPVPKSTTNNIVKETNNPNDAHLAVRVEDKGDYAEFVWKPSQSIQPNGSYPIHLEFYYNPLPGTGNKVFAYQFRAAQPVDQAKVFVLQPLKASNFKMEPAGQLLGQDSHGFQVYGLNSTSLKTGDKIDLKVSYTKDDPSPSVQKPSGATGQPAAGQAGENQLSSATIIIPMVVFFLFIVIIAVRASRNRDNEEAAVSPRASNQKSRGANNKPAGSSRQNADSRLANGGGRPEAGSRRAAGSIRKATGGGKPAYTDRQVQEKRQLRQMLLDGEISEETYLELVAEIEADN